MFVVTLPCATIIILLRFSSGKGAVLTPCSCGFLGGIYNYIAISNSFNKIIGENLDKESVKNLIFRAYDLAYSNDMIGANTKKGAKNDSFSFFVLPDVKTESNERVFVKCPTNKNPGFQKWYGAYVVAESELKDELLDCYTIHYGPFIFGHL